MGRTKEDFIQNTGGLRLGENQAEFHARIQEIQRLEKAMLSSPLEDIEKIQRRICELKGIDFDSYDDPNE